MSKGTVKTALQCAKHFFSHFHKNGKQNLWENIKFLKIFHFPSICHLDTPPQAHTYIHTSTHSYTHTYWLAVSLPQWQRLSTDMEIAEIREEDSARLGGRCLGSMKWADISGGEMSGCTSEDCSRREMKKWGRQLSKGPKYHPSHCPALKHANLPQSHQEAGRGTKWLPAWATVGN